MPSDAALLDDLDLLFRAKHQGDCERAKEIIARLSDVELGRLQHGGHGFTRLAVLVEQLRRASGRGGAKQPMLTLIGGGLNDA